MHGQIFKFYSQNAEYVETRFNELNIPFCFACQKRFNQLD